MTSAVYGTTSGGQQVRQFTLINGDLEATLLDLGGTITGLSIRGRNVVTGLADLAAYEKSGWWNCLIGRYANRLKNGFTLDGKHYPLAQDDNGVTLHGGRGQSWGARVWSVTEESETELGLRLVSPDGDQGFPGAVTVDVTYTLQPDGLRLDYTATTTAPTPVNFTNHIYFNLAGEGLVTGQLLQLNADSVTPTDVHQIPTGAITSVEGTAFDFRRPAPIGERVDSAEEQMRIAGGLDHNLVLNGGGGLEWAARMTDPSSGRKLEVLTTEPGCQVYSTNNVKPGTLDAQGREIPKRGALALETQHFPDAPNHANFPATILRPGETFRSTTLFRLT
jgi:aldose 1-epimerase